jgi:hypothetical protein
VMYVTIRDISKSGLITSQNAVLIPSSLYSPATSDPPENKVHYDTISKTKYFQLPASIQARFRESKHTTRQGPNQTVFYFYISVYSSPTIIHGVVASTSRFSAALPSVMENQNCEIYWVTPRQPPPPPVASHIPYLVSTKNPSIGSV